MPLESYLMDIIKSRRFHFGLRSLLLLLTILAVFFAYTGFVIRRGTQQKSAISCIAGGRGGVAYELGGGLYLPRGYSPDGVFTRTLRNLFGDEYFGHVREVAFIRPLKDLSPLTCVDDLSKVSHLSLLDQTVTDETLEAISRIKQLKSLGLNRCHIDPTALAVLNLLPHIESITLVEPAANDQIAIAHYFRTVAGAGIMVPEGGPKHGRTHEAEASPLRRRV